MDIFGFIIVRCVNSEKTNRYWNQNIKLLRTFYPFAKIIVIDDDSNPAFVSSDFEYKNVEIIQSEFPKRGELLPYYYFLKYKFFKNAVILHDSTFFHKRFAFEKLNGINVLPLWHFNSDSENVENTKRIISCLKNNQLISGKLSNDTTALGLTTDKWCGCFGVQSYISLSFLERIQEKYNIINLIHMIKCRSDRCCLERILGAIFNTECPWLFNQKSLFGDIIKYHKWGYTYDEYIDDFNKGTIPKIIVKVWTGR